MNWLRGYLSCRVDAGNWERFMNLCRHRGIELWKVKKRENRVEFCMYIKDYKELTAFVEKTHVVPHICDKNGFPFVCEKAIRDWTFSLGIVVFFIILKVLSLFIWQVNYVGQQEYTKESVNQQVVRLGVYPGMRKKDLDCDQLERSLREIYDNMSWVSAEEEGCVLNIKIKEGNALGAIDAQEEEAFHLVAPCDGTIQSIITTKGTAQVKKGDVVKKGEILIRGVVEVTDDSEMVVARHGVCADGEIVLEGELRYEDRINDKHIAKTKTGKDIAVYTIEVNGHRISLKNPLKWFDNSGNYDIINYVCGDKEFVPMGLQCRVSRKNYIHYVKKTAAYQEDEAKDILKRRFASKLAEYKDDGYEIADSTLRVQKQGHTYVAKGNTKIRIKEMEKQLVNEGELQIQTIGKEDEVGNNF